VGARFSASQRRLQEAAGLEQGDLAENSGHYLSEMMCRRNVSGTARNSNSVVKMLEMAEKMEAVK
jgi:hypothetical protein